jgi:hypothetical protein
MLLLAASDSSQSRRPPTVRWLMGQRPGVVAVDDQPGDFVLLVGNQHFVQKGAQRHVGQTHLCGHALLGAAGGNPGQLVARTQRRGAGQQGFQVVKR